MVEPDYVRRQREDAIARKRQEEEDYRRKEQERAERYQRKLDEHARDQRARDAEHERQRQRQRERDRQRGVGTCFPGETCIATPRGPRPISELRAGDEVLSRDPSGRVSSVRVRRHLMHPPALLWEVCVAGRNEPILATRSHSFRTTHGWRRASTLGAGDVLVGQDGSPFIVTAVRASERVDHVYNIHVEGDGSFVADGCVVHSFTYFRALRVWWQRLGSRAQHAPLVASSGAAR